MPVAARCSMAVTAPSRKTMSSTSGSMRAPRSGSASSLRSPAVIMAPPSCDRTVRLSALRGRAGTVAPVRIGVLASGSGTILEAILAEGIGITAVVADRKCRALEVARDAGVDAVLVERVDFSKTFDRAAYCDQLVGVLRELELDLIVSAGFGTVVPGVTTAFPGRMINTH